MISNRLSTRLSLTTTTDNNSGNGGGNLNNPGRGNGSNTRSSLGSSPLAVGRHISRLGHNFELEEEQVAGSGQQHYDGMSSSLLSLVWSNSSSSALSKKDNREQQSPLGLSDATTPTSTPNRNHGRSHAQHHHQSSSPNPWCLLFLLNVVAIIWGTQHPIIKIVVDSGSDFDDGVITKAMSNKEVSSATDNVSPALAVLLRFAVAAILSSPSIISMIFRPRKRIAKIWRWGFELGIYMTTGFALQAMALTITTAQRSGFLLYLNVKFVPLFGWILGGKRISIISWTSAFVALVGTALLTLGGQDTTPFNLGDILAIGSAITSALFIWRLEIASSQLQVTLSSALDEEGGNDRGTRNLNSAFESSTDEKDGILKKNSPSHRHNNTATSISASLHSTTMCSVTLGCLIWTLYIQITTNDSNYIAETFPVLIENHGWEILYLALIPTALSNFLQTYVQRFVSSERATIVYSMDPVYGAIASYILLGETLGSVWGYVGAALIFLASLTGVVFPPSSTSMSSDDREDDDSFIPFLSPSEDGSDEDAMAKTASACMDNKRPHNDELELYSDYRNWVEGWGTLVGIGLAIFSIAVNSYAAALIIFQESPSSGGANNASDSVQNTRFGFLIYACLLAALVSLWVALREMKLVLDGSEEDAWTKYRLLRALAQEEEDHRARLLSKLGSAKKRQVVLEEYNRQIQQMIPTYSNIETRMKISQSIQLSKDIQVQRECRFREELLQEIITYAVRNDLPLLTTTEAMVDEDSDENGILKHLEQTRPDVSINHDLLSKKIKRCNKSGQSGQPRRNTGISMILIKDVAIQNKTVARGSASTQKKSRRIIKFAV